MMLTHRSKLYKFFVLLMALIVIALLITPGAAHAAGSPTISIVNVRPDESVTIRAYNFPGNQIFTVRMDVIGNAAVNGIIVTYTNSGAGGSFEETYRIPTELKGKGQLAIRLESSSDTYAYNWFNNTATSASPTPVSTIVSPSIPVTGGVSPAISIVGVEKNKAITIEARRFPANTNFNVRVGPFYNFWKGGVVVTTINSGNGGTFRFTINLPDQVKDVELVSVRLDSPNKYYAYNVFSNATSGTIGDSVQNVCSIVSVSPGASLTRRADFDAVWTVKNTSSKNWELSSVDYKYLSGEKIYKKDARYDFTKTVKPGETIKIVVDMVAPNATGYFSTTWGIVTGSTTLCSLPLTIHVK